MDLKSSRHLPLSFFFALVLVLLNVQVILCFRHQSLPPPEHLHHHHNHDHNVDDDHQVAASESSSSFGQRLNQHPKSTSLSRRMGLIDSPSPVIEDPTVPVAILTGSDLEYSDTLNGEVTDSDQQVLYINHGGGAVSSVRRSFSVPATFSPHVNSYPSSPFDNPSSAAITKRSDELNSLTRSKNVDHNDDTEYESPPGSVMQLPPVDISSMSRIQEPDQPKRMSLIEDDEYEQMPPNFAALFPDDIPRIVNHRTGHDHVASTPLPPPIEPRSEYMNGGSSPFAGDDFDSSRFDDAPTEQPEPQRSPVPSSNSGGAFPTSTSSLSENRRRNNYNEHSFTVHHPSPSANSRSPKSSSQQQQHQPNSGQVSPFLGSTAGGNNNNNLNPFFNPIPLPLNPVGNSAGQNGNSNTGFGPQTLNPFFNLFNPETSPLFQPLAPASGLNRGPSPLAAPFNPLSNVRSSNNNQDDNLFQRRRLTNGNGNGNSDNSINSLNYPAYNYYRGDSDDDALKWPKIFKFTDGRINLNDFEKDKKLGRVSFSNKDRDLDNVRRDSFLILHGGTYS